MPYRQIKDVHKIDGNFFSLVYIYIFNITNKPQKFSLSQLVYQP